MSCQLLQVQKERRRSKDIKKRITKNTQRSFSCIQHLLWLYALTTFDCAHHRISTSRSCSNSCSNCRRCWWKSASACGFSVAETKTVEVLTSGIETWSPNMYNHYWTHFSSKLSISLDVHSFPWRFWILNVLETSWMITYHCILGCSNILGTYSKSMICLLTYSAVNKIYDYCLPYDLERKEKIIITRAWRTVPMTEMLTMTESWLVIQITDEASFIGFPLVISDGGLSSARLVESMGAQVANDVWPTVSSKTIGRAHCCNVPCELWKKNTPTSNPEVICFVGIPASTNTLIQSSCFGPLCPFYAIQWCDTCGMLQLTQSLGCFF